MFRAELKAFHASTTSKLCFLVDAQNVLARPLQAITLALPVEPKRGEELKESLTLTPRPEDEG